MEISKDNVRNALYSFTITRKILEFRKRFYDWKRIAYPILLKKWKNPNAVFFVMTPEHSNIGDHAIAYSQKIIFDDLNIRYIEITANRIFELFEYDFLSVVNRRTIFVNGGGNLGTLWFNVENAFRGIIIANPHSKIICLPNTFFYEESDWGRDELEKSKIIYNSHKNLIIYAREQQSYNAMKDIYNNVKLVPDMVLRLNFSGEQVDRKGCLLCLRSDVEKTITNDEIKDVENKAKQLFGENVNYTDMCISHNVSIENRYNEVLNKINEFKSAELVVTDRLHGMIFCAISGTPCIVLNSKSPKVKGCYEWIKHLEYIKFAENIEDIDKLYSSIPKKQFNYDNTNISHFYDILKTDISETCQGE